MSTISSPGGTTTSDEKQGEGRTLDGQTHDVNPDALAPVLMELFSS